MNEESPGHRADLATGFTAGSLLGGYRLEEQVGAGGMAVVFRARDERLDRLVALKIMTPAMGSDDMFRQRFIRESRAAAAVDDPHIIPVYEAGEAGQVLFIAMRFVQGGDVRSLLRREGPLPPDRVASIFSPVASALDAAHAVGLVHRDVKPANILLDRRPGRPEHVYLSDFGLSKSAEVSLGLTAAGQFLGTPDYTAPEQIEGLPVDGRTDQYALACAVFELLTGQAPFHRPETFAAIWAHLHKPPPSLTERRSELSPAVDPVMAKALAKAQVDRYRPARSSPTRCGTPSAWGHITWVPPPTRGCPGLGRAARLRLRRRPLPDGSGGGGGRSRSASRGGHGSKRGLRRPAADPGRLRGRPAARDEASTPEDQATDPGRPVSPEDRPVSPEDSADDQDEEDPSPPRQPPESPAPEGGPPTARPLPRNKPGAPGKQPGVPDTRPHPSRTTAGTAPVHPFNAYRSRRPGHGGRGGRPDHDLEHDPGAYDQRP